MSEEMKNTAPEVAEPQPMRDYETLLKVGPKKMSNDELCFMVNKLKKDKDTFEQQATAYQSQCEQAYERVREAEGRLNAITSSLNLQFDFILRQAQLMRDSIYLTIKGGHQ